MPPQAQPSSAERELKDYLAMQAMVADLLSAFVHLSHEELDSGIDEALARLGTFCQVDRTYVFSVHGDRMTNTHEWCAAGIAPEIDNLQDIALAEIAAWVDPLSRGEPAVVADVDALGPDREAERTLLSAQGIRSLLVTPMLSAGHLVGFVGFDSVRGLRQFLPGELSLLRAVTDVITSAMVRRESRRVADAAANRLAALTRSSSDLIAVLDDDGCITWASASFSRFGLAASSLTGTPWPLLLDVEFRDDTMAQLAQVGSEVTHGGDVLLAMPWGEPSWIAVSYTDLRNDPSVRGVVLNAHDVTARRRIEERLAHEATHDPLTGLANRTLLDRSLADACLAARETTRNVTVAFVDLDRFKLVNDALGHEVGDALLVATAERLSRCIDDADLVARFGGDEFVVLVPDLPRAVGPDGLADRIREAFIQPFDLRGAAHHVTVSVGIAQGTRSGLDADTLLRDADTAMYEAKARGRNRSVTFDRSLYARVSRRAELVRRLPVALASGAIEVHYQPIVDLTTGALVGSEALARWTDPEIGDVSPAEFIGVAEELGLIAELGEQVLGMALDAVSRWPPHLGVSVNLSAMQLTDVDLPDRIAEELTRHGVPAGRVTLEVTESILVELPRITHDVLSRLRALGAKIAMDDFGTGYSSLALLRDLPIDVLKIDRAFVNTMTDSARDHRLVRAIIGIADDLGMRTTAEGVETTAQLDALRALGCTRAQGWLLGRPAPEAAFRRVVEEQPIRSSCNPALSGDV